MRNNNKPLVKERRRSERIRQNLTVTRCATKYLFDHNYLSQDISEEGICLLSQNKMEIGEVIEIGIVLDEDMAPLTATGKVMRRNETNDIKYPFLVGIEFLNMSSKDKNLLKAHLKYYVLKE